MRGVQMRALVTFLSIGTLISLVHSGLSIQRPLDSKKIQKRAVPPGLHHDLNPLAELTPSSPVASVDKRSPHVDEAQKTSPTELAGSSHTLEERALGAQAGRYVKQGQGQGYGQGGNRGGGGGGGGYQGGRKPTTPVKIRWFIVPERVDLYADDPNAVPEPRFQNRQAVAAGLGTAVAIFTAAAGTFRAVTGLISTGQGIFSGTISNMQGIASLIREGIDLAAIFGLSLKQNMLLIDNRCDSCKLEVRCWDRYMDSGLNELQYPDSIILRFTTVLPYNIQGLITFTCEYHDRNRGLSVTHDAYGGASPREMVNLYEIREDGIYRIDQATGRIDMRQQVKKWNS